MQIWNTNEEDIFFFLFLVRVVIAFVLVDARGHDHHLSS